MIISFPPSSKVPDGGYCGVGRQKCKFLFGVGDIYYTKDDPGKEGLGNHMLGSWVNLFMTLTCSAKSNFVP